MVAALNGQELKLAKFCGVFPWHHHEHEDELFLVWRGQMVIEFRDRRVLLQPGELCVVPRGVEHRTMADDEAEVLIELLGQSEVPRGDERFYLYDRHLAHGCAP